MDLILRAMFDWGPFLMLPAFLGASLIPALLLSRALRSKGSFTRGSSLALAPFTAIGITAVAIVVWIYLAPSLPQTPFVKEHWDSMSWRRASMVENLVASRLHVGMTKREVHSLLGDDDGSYDLGDSWYIPRPKDAFDLMPPELVIQYDKSGRVRRFFVEPGFLDVLVLGETAPG